MSARISVVVPVYNVAPYLATCLESLAGQTMADLEIVMVDDGSTDESPGIAERFAARDARFRLVRQANAGLGAARNTGAAHATGELIAFADSDDVLPRHAYELLCGALDESGSDFATGNVRRLTSLGTTRVGFLARAFERTRLSTHITRFPPLLADRMAWNKLFRRSFWDRHGLRFPTGVYYEDTPVTLPAHYLARSVDVVAEPVYLWRMREGADLSITQRRTETKALRDRVAAVDHVSRFLAEQGLPVSKALYDRSVVGDDLRHYLDVLASADDEYRRLFIDLANEFVDRADRWALERPLAIDRLKWQLVRRRALPELLEVLRFEDEELAERPPVKRSRGWYGDYPYRGDERLGIPDGVYRLEDELAPVLRVNDVRWEGETLRIEGYAYITMLGAPRPDSQELELVARQRNWWRRRLRLRTERVHRPDVTATAAQQFAGLDWSGFVATLDAAELARRGGGWRDSTWDIGAVIRTGGVVRSTWRPEAAPLHPAATAEVRLDDGTRVRAWLSAAGRLTVKAQRREAAIRAYGLDQGVLELEGEIGSGAGGGVALEVERRIGGAALRYPVHVDRSRRPSTFLARVLLEDIVREDDADDGVVRLEEQPEGIVWDLFLAGRDGDRAPLVLHAAAPESTWTLNGREIAVQRTRNGNFAITERSFRPVVTEAEWTSGGTLAVAGSFRAPAGEYELVLSARARPDRHAFPLRYDAEAERFAASLTPAAVTSQRGTHPLAEGLWMLGVRRRAAEGEPGAAAVLGKELRRTLPLSAEVARKRFHFGVIEADAAVLGIERDLAEGERGGFAQRRLRTSFYPAKRSAPLRDAVVYDSFGGREYSDSPRAIHEELVRRDAPFEHLWVVRDGAFQPPATATALRHGSREHYEALAHTRYVVANDHWPRWFRRRPEQVCLQTWHGWPLKRQGHALADRPKAVHAYRRALGQRAENWQYLLSPDRAATPVLEGAFPVGEAVLETGLPRTDVLVRPSGERVESVKRRLGLAGKSVVLYAPTYHDGLAYRPATRVVLLRDVPTYGGDVRHRGGYRLGRLLDFAALDAGLGDGHVVLFRKHPRVLDSLPAAAAPLVRDVSAYPDAMELLLVADVLVTDYSSLAFDFAATGRPIVFFTPDLRTYRDDVRGFSLDLEAAAPGPLLETTGDVVDALRDLDAVRAGYRERYERFVASYCSLADGNASGRVVDRVFRW